MKEEKLLELKAKIDKAKTTLSELKGKKEVLMSTLEEKGCKTVKEAEKKVKQFQEEVDALEAKKEKKIEELEENYEL